MDQDHALVGGETIGTPVEVIFQKRNSVAVIFQRQDDTVGEGEYACLGGIQNVHIENIGIRCDGEGGQGVGGLPALQFPTELLKGVFCENFGENGILGNSVKFCICPDFFIDWITIDIGSRVDSGGLLKVGCFIMHGPPSSLGGGGRTLYSELFVVGGIDFCGKSGDSGKVPGCRNGLTDGISCSDILFGHNRSAELQGGQLVEYTAVSRILHGEHPFQVPTNFVQDIGDGILAFWNVQVELIEVFLVLLVKLEQGIGRNAGIDDIFSIITGVIPTIGAVESGVGICNSRGRMVFYGRIRVTCGTGVDTGIFFGKFDGGALEVEELE